MTFTSKESNPRQRMLKTLVASTALTLIAGHAQAISLDFGEVTGAFDTTVSAGVSMSMSDPDRRFIGGGNGGLQPTDSFVVIGGNAAGDPITISSNSLPAASGGTVAQETNAFAAGINGDDGRLNYDKHDIFSANVKVTSDLILNWENYTFFTRGTAFYDFVGDDAGHTNRSDLDDNVRSEIGKEAEILDLYVSGDFDLGDEYPLQVRLGKQVVSWGESTFNINGINVINPIDVTKFRKPGSELKEGLTPVWMAYAQLGLPNDLSVEAFYQIKYDNFTLDPQGTFFSGSDNVSFTNSAAGGNPLGQPMLGSTATSGDYYRNCNAAAPGSLLSIQPDARCDNGTSSFVHYTRPYVNAGAAFVRDPSQTTVNSEQARVNADDTHILARFDQVEADDSGQFGVAMRYYSEELNSTEFGFYYMNYHSRLPLVNFAYNKDTMGYGSNYATSTGLGLESAGTAGVANLFGCAPLASAFSTAAGLAGAGNVEGAKAVVQGALATNAQTGVLSADQLAFMSQDDGTNLGDPANLAPLYATSTNALTLLGNPTGLTTGQAYALLGGDVAADGRTDSYSSTLLRCLQTLSNTAASSLSPIGAFATAGTEVMSFDYNSGLGIQVEYPEDIKLYGISFNTLLGDWSVQGELAYRQDQPLQLESSELFGVSLIESCVLNGLGAVIYDSLQAGSKYLNTPSCNTADTGLNVVQGYKRKDVLTGTLGVTTLLPQSNQIVEFFGATDMLILGEATFTKVRDMEGPEELLYAGTGAYCSLSAFGSLLNVDRCPNGSTQVYPDSFSWGYTLVSRLTYPDVFAGINLTPQFVFRHDVHGDTPGPISNHLEGRKAVSLALNANYQSAWTGSISYTNNFGADRRNTAGDRDFASVSVSYSF